jgi:hypothetical protein
LETEAPQDIECWPDNWMPLQVFKAMDTQWNVGPHSVIGLRYEALQIVMDVMGVNKKARAELLQALRIMEQEALQVLNSKNG